MPRDRAPAQLADEPTAAGPSSGPVASARTPWGLLAALVVVALVVRAIALDSGLWIDEIYSLVRSFRSPFSTIVTEYWGDNHHPLYAVLAHASIATFGEAPWTLRLPAMLFGVASVPMLYALGVLVATRLEALLAAALLTVSYHHVWFSQNARGYSALAFWTLLATWALLRGLRAGERRYFVLYAVAAALGTYTHLTMVFVVAGHALAAAWVVVRGDRWAGGPGRWREPALGFLLAGALTLALYAPMLADVRDYFLQHQSELKGISTPKWAFWEALRVLRLGLSGGVAVVGLVVLAGGALAVGSGLASYARRSVAIVLAFLLPAFVTVSGAALARGTMYPRFFFFMIGIAMLIVVRGAMVVSRAVATRLGGARGEAMGTRLATALVLVVILASAASLSLNYRFPKQDFGGAMRYVLAHRQSGDVVVSAGVPTDPYSALYGQSWPRVASVDDLRKARAAGRRVWLLYTFPRYLESGAPELAAVIERDCAPARVFRGTVGGGDIIVCTMEPSS